MFVPILAMFLLHYHSADGSFGMAKALSYADTSNRQESSTTYELETGVHYGGKNIGNCGSFKTREELEAACTADSNCVGYSTHLDRGPWCLKRTEDSTATITEKQNYYRKISMNDGTEKMCPLCTSCDISGSETMAGSGLSLDQCKSKCLDNASCRGIDFGKGGRAGQCYLNLGQNVNFGSHSDFDGYSKNSDCANVGNVECCRLVKKHPTMIPGKSWGDMARWVHGADRQYWQDHGCDAKVGGSSKSKCPR